jgi:hypothetical protein
MSFVNLTLDNMGVIISLQSTMLKFARIYVIHLSLIA